MKTWIISIFGAIASFITYLFGGWDYVFITLLIFMSVDLITGVVVAGVFHNSPKTKKGALESRQGWKGLCRKFIILFFVLIGHRLDIVFDVEYIKNFVCYAYMVNELLSIVENAGLMGVPIPKVITNAIEILKSKTEGETENGQNNLP